MEWIENERKIFEIPSINYFALFLTAENLNFSFNRITYGIHSMIFEEEIAIKEKEKE